MSDNRRAYVIDYVHYNPVNHGYVKRPGDLLWSSFDRAQRDGSEPSIWEETELVRLRGMDFERQHDSRCGST